MKGIDILNQYFTHEEKIGITSKMCNIDYYLYINDYMDGKEFLEQSFIWSHTVEGHDYWHNISLRLKLNESFNIKKTIKKHKMV